MAEPRKTLRGRFLRQKICSSRTVAAFIKKRGPWAGLILERMITFADDDGRQVAEPQVIKANTLPWHDRSVKYVQDDLLGMATAGIIILYRVGGTQYAAYPKWRQHQPAVRAERYIPSELPPPPPAQSSVQSSDIPSDDSLPVGGAVVGPVSGPVSGPVLALGDDGTSPSRKGADRKLSDDQNSLKQTALDYWRKRQIDHVGIPNPRWLSKGREKGGGGAAAGFFTERILETENEFALDDFMGITDLFFDEWIGTDSPANFDHFMRAWNGLCRKWGDPKKQNEVRARREQRANTPKAK